MGRHRAHFLSYHDPLVEIYATQLGLHHVMANLDLRHRRGLSSRKASEQEAIWVQLPSECLDLLGASPDTRMLLLKPCDGQIDAPQAWFLAAVDKLKSMGLRQHPLDPCCFLMYEGDLEPNFDPTTNSEHLLGPHGLWNGDRAC